MLGRYVKYKSLSYLVCRIDAGIRPHTQTKVHIIRPGSQKKLHVAMENLSMISCPPAKTCYWQDGKYLVTQKGNILSMATMRWMEWPEVHGGRLELLRQAGVISDEKRCYQCDKPTKWLAPDSRCGDCTRFTPEEITGETVCL